MPPVSAASPLASALRAHLQANVPTCPRWYPAGAVPADTPLPYGTFGDHNEARAGFLGRGGSTLRPTLKVFSSYVGDKELLTIWGELYAALYGARLAVAGHTQILGDPELVTTYLDPHNVRNAVVRYTVRTLEGEG